MSWKSPAPTLFPQASKEIFPIAVTNNLDRGDGKRKLDEFGWTEPCQSLTILANPHNFKIETTGTP
jgi:hypothetical protein